MKKRKPGRPAQNETVVTPDAILATALDMLDRDGAEALTMRKLATRIGINPMTVSYHFGDRDGLIKAIAESAYANVDAPATGTPRQRMTALLRSYHQQVVQHPGLTLSIFGNANAFPDQAQRISDSLRLLLRESGLSAAKARQWMHILVDFTHGAGLATAMQQPDARNRSAVASATADYARSLKTLLEFSGTEVMQ